MHPHGDQMGRRVLRAARAKDVVAAVLDQRELARIEDHAHLVALKDELLIARARPGHLRQPARLEVAHHQRLVRRCDKEAVLVDVDPLHLMPKVRLEHDPCARRETLHDNRRCGDVGELKAALIPHAPNTRVVHVHRAAERADHQPRSVTLPPERSHSVQVLNLLEPGVAPASVRREREDAEAVEGADDNRLPRRIEGRTRELLLRLVAGVVKALKHRPILVVKADGLVGPRCADRLAPRESVGHA
mmetsp:Transcript_24440/g.72494  ORF Transcript_24440/g.72494 Transcript_24440/m.72494 type:complete len:246 (+) Transcript_24440:3893-4630(+)